MPFLCCLMSPCISDVPRGLSCELMKVVDTSVLHSHQLPPFARSGVLFRL